MKKINQVPNVLIFTILITLAGYSFTGNFLHAAGWGIIAGSVAQFVTNLVCDVVDQFKK